MTAAAPADATSVRFSRDSVEAFADFSHDRNALHLDPEYARRTPFGDQVVHGIAGVLASLRPLLSAGPLRLTELRCTFPGPLFLERDYPIAAVVPGETAGLALGAPGGRKVEGRARFVAAPAVPIPAQDGEPAGPLRDGADPGDIPAAGTRLTGSYGVRWAAFGRLASAVDARLAHLPPAQLECLAWASFFCGMVVPGRQSLVLELSFEFAPAGPPTCAALQYEVVVGRRDTRFGMLEMTAALAGDGLPLANVGIRALVRPAPVSFSLAEVRTALGASQVLRGATAVVTGASRGLGAQLAAGLALHGCGVVVGYRAGAEQAAALQRALQELDVPVVPVRGELGTPEGCRALRRAVADTSGSLDILVLNASPPIRPFGFAELGNGESARFVAAALDLTTGPLRELLPLVEARHGWVVVISSTYVADPPRRFSHYVAAKAAVEATARAVAAEYPTVKFMIVRAPKILTDQTNVNFDLEPAAPATGIVGRILAALSHPPSEGNVVLVEA